MEGSSSKGRGLAMAIGIYAVVKAVLNGIIGSFAIFDIIIAIAILVFMIFGIKYSNYIIAALMVLVVAKNFGHNISDIGANWIYLLEAAIDIICAAVLCLSSDVKAFFSGNDSSSDSEN
jgi:hypothetical protein